MAVPLLLAATPVFWELMVTGHDVIALGFCFALIALALHRYVVVGSTRIGPLVILGIFIGLVATSRIVFICLPGLVWILTARFYPKRAFFLAGISLAVAVGLHFYFYSISAYYQPLHLFGRGERNVGLPLIAGGLCLTGVLAVIAWLRVRPTLASITGWCSTLLAVPLGLIAVGELMSAQWNLALWEGANYIVPVIPVYLFYLMDGRGMQSDGHNPSDALNILENRANRNGKQADTVSARELLRHHAPLPHFHPFDRSRCLIAEYRNGNNRSSRDESQ